jgi:hypothetical protein
LWYTWLQWMCLQSLSPSGLILDVTSFRGNNQAWECLADSPPGTLRPDCYCIILCLSPSVLSLLLLLIKQRENSEVIKKNICRVLPPVALGKEAGRRSSGCPLCRVLLTGLSAKKASRVGVDAVLCRESDGDTRQRIRPRWRAVTATFLCRGPLLALGKHFAESPRRSSRQSILCRPRLPREPFAEWGSRQNVCRVPLRLCRVPGALGKSAASGSVSIPYKDAK